MQGIAGKYVHFAAEDDEKRILFLEDNVQFSVVEVRFFLTEFV
jgi:hypothetical protein